MTRRMLTSIVSGPSDSGTRALLEMGGVGWGEGMRGTNQLFLVLEVLKSDVILEFRLCLLTVYKEGTNQPT